MSAGLFATARRGGLTSEQIREIEAHRNRERPTPWQALAARYGQPVAAIMEAANTAPLTPVAANETKDQPFYWTAERIRQLRILYIDADLSAEKVAEILGCSRESVIGKANRLGFGKLKMKAEAVAAGHALASALRNPAHASPVLAPIADVLEARQ